MEVGKLSIWGGEGVEVEHLIGVPNCHILRILAAVCVTSHVCHVYVVLVGSNTGIMP